MSIQLVITEKPSVAADVARALRAERFERTEWGYRGQSTWIAAAAGHLVAELNPDEYDQRYKTWSYADLPIIPEAFKYKPRDARAGERLRTLVGLIRDPQVSVLVNACDAGREGELIYKLVLQAARLETPKPVLRAWFSSMTETAIQQAFASLRPDREMWPLEAAARCRSEADWLVGINATRAATCTLGGGRTMFSLGRVQTPTLALVVERDLEIENFVPSEYFTVEATFGGGAGPYQGSWRESRESEARDRLATRAEADLIADGARAAGQGVLDSVETRTERIAPPKLFDLTGLQREANKRWGLSASTTLAAAQACYETHKVLTYPRTDSCHITTDMAAMIPTLVAALGQVPTFAVAATALVTTGVDPSPIVNDAKVSDHHGLLPTGETAALAQLSDTERRIYELVVWRLLAALSPEQVQERTIAWTRVETPAGRQWYRSQGVRVLSAGWKAVWPTSAKNEDEDGNDEDRTLPALAQGETVRVEAVEVEAHWTKAPARYNEASLLGAMAAAGKLVDDEELAEAMKERGLGTPATRAAIIEKLISVEYLERRKRQLVATDKGRGLILALGEHSLVSPELTGVWEARLRQVEHCDPAQVAAMRNDFSRSVREFTQTVTASLGTLTPADARRGQRQISGCPMSGCAGSVIAGRKGWGCSSYVSKEQPGCGFVWWFEQGGKKRSEKQLLEFIEEVRAGRASVRTASTPRVVLGLCPRPGCGGEILEREKGWGCNSWKSPNETGCGFVIWKKNPDGSVVSAEEAEAMRSAGTSNAKPRPKALRPCPMPRCKGEIVERERSYSCTSWKSPQSRGCGLTLWKTARDGSILVTAETFEIKLAEAVEAAAEARAARRRGKV
jgi:DNA topoisomerase-3